ncbi:alpha/beta hydrolase-fold protein [Providencia sneebia]|uniref:Esterase n=1 Tax=Providencia sneebia DSM 19967 TaxID=1141660 RepID=K8WIE1_9GAMM|nr:alpha/beta hydrolase-fold protein [Providencia sneebia]EKT55980.1 esterase [Providencia sneebia DSM 19967]
MKSVLLCTMIAISAAPAIASPCKELPSQGTQAGTFDANGKVCFQFPAFNENYIVATLNGATDAQLLDQQNHDLRTLLEAGPADGEKSLLFALPIGQTSSLMLYGNEGANWHFNWDIKETKPLNRAQNLYPISPTLQQLTKELATGKTTDEFWKQQKINGTPLVEPIDATHKRVTFLWRSARGNVFILGSPAGDHDPMFKLGDSDVWFRSYVVPADTRMQYQLAPDVPKIAGNARDQRRAILVSAQADPLNPHTMNIAKVDRWNKSSLLDLKPTRYFTQETMSQPIRHGSLTRHSLKSERLENSREILLYSPNVNSPASWTLFLFDGQIWQDKYHTANVLDALIANHQLPPVNIVFIDSLDSKRRSDELPANQHFADFMAHELLPWVKQNGIPVHEGKTIVAGASYGGLASSWVALQYPMLFSNVLSLSGSYWWAPEGEKAGWLIRQYQQSQHYPVRFWIQAGLFEAQGVDGGIWRNSQDLEQVLRDKKYRTSFHSWSSGHDYAAWVEALVDGLRDLTKSN